MPLTIPEPWQALLGGEPGKPYAEELQQFVAREREQHSVFPAEEDVFAALQLATPGNVRVVILGQDPYHGAGQAHGLSFSVRRGIKPPPSLKNIYKELASDIGCEIPDHGCLEDWARQGVLLLNTVLTVREATANSHRKHGWETLTDCIIRTVSDLPRPIAFVLWGGPAQKKRSLIDDSRHLIVQSAHPSPLSAHRGFLGSKPFSQINSFLAENGQKPIDWKLQ